MCLPCIVLAVQDYSDYAGKFGGAALGVAAACISVLRGKRRFTWSWSRAVGHQPGTCNQALWSPASPLQS